MPATAGGAAGGWVGVYLGFVDGYTPRAGGVGDGWVVCYWEFGGRGVPGFPGGLDTNVEAAGLRACATRGDGLAYGPLKRARCSPLD